MNRATSVGARAKPSSLTPRASGGNSRSTCATVDVDPANWGAVQHGPATRLRRDHSAGGTVSGASLEPSAGGRSCVTGDRYPVTLGRSAIPSKVITRWRGQRSRQPGGRLTARSACQGPWRWRAWGCAAGELVGTASQDRGERRPGQTRFRRSACSPHGVSAVKLSAIVGS